MIISRNYMFQNLKSSWVVTMHSNSSEKRFQTIVRNNGESNKKRLVYYNYTSSYHHIIHHDIIPKSLYL